MKPFLKQVVDHYYRMSDISERTFVFPNRRSMIFFRKYLSEAVASDVRSVPMIAPKMMTMSDFFAGGAGLVPVDRVTLLLELFECYSLLNPQHESLDEFIFWGDVILGDFDDVDKYLVDPERIFTNVADYKAIQDTYSYLSANQRAVMETFFGHFSTPAGSMLVDMDSDAPGVKEKFLKVWNILLPLYRTFNLKLEEKGMSYEGMLYRRLVSHLEKNFPEEIFGTGNAYVFVGLNALNECESVVLKNLQKSGMAEFCWDWSGDMMMDQTNRSSHFLRSNIREFPPAFVPEGREDNATEFNVLSVPSSYGQVKHLEQILSRIDDLSGADTAVVLPDESLLMPLLNSIPVSVDDINVTMGYPLSASNVFVLMSDVVKMQMHMRKKEDGWYFYHKQVWDILSSGLFRTLASGEDMALCREKADAVRREGRYYVPQHELNGHPLLDLFFKPVVTDLSSRSSQMTDALADYLQSILSGIAPVMKKTQESAVELEAAKTYYTAVNSLRSRHLPILPATFMKLVDSLAAGTSVPFKGEPLKGMQVMGPLETRALDFRNVVIFSCNEGTFPRRSVSSSFIPPELRKGFNLPTYEYQDAVWSYYFYRLVSRAENVWLVYDSRTEGLKRGEESRYIKQLKYHYGIRLNRYVADAGLASSDREDEAVVKTDEIMSAIDNMTFSASALQNYVFCPMKFYYQSVLKMKADEDVAESLDNRMIGNVYHNAMWALYHGEDAMMSDKPFEKMENSQERGQDEVTMEYLKKWQSDAMLPYVRAKVESLMKAELNVDEIRGRDLVVRTVIIRYVLETIRKDMELLGRYGVSSFRVVGLEKKVSAEICGCRFFGVMDRVDSVVPGSVRLVDYKSGAESQKVLSVPPGKEDKAVSEIFDGKYARKKDMKAVLQFYIYDRMMVDTGLAEEGRLYNSLYSTAEMFKDAPVLNEVNPEFYRKMGERLQMLLAELRDKDIPFERTKDKDACRWCDFRMICGR